MSIPVDLAALHEQIIRFGPGAFLVTTSSDGPPHVSSVVVTVTPDGLVMGGGLRTHANVAERPAVSLVWSAGNEVEYCLIVDGAASRADIESENLVVVPTSAVLHRLANASAELPRCLPLETST